MSWIDKIKKFISLPSLKGLINIDEVNFIKIIKNDHSEKIHKHDLSKNLTINIEKLSPEEKEALKSTLSSAIGDGQTILQEESKVLIEDFKTKDGSPDTKRILEYLRPKIPTKDIPIWRAALYLKKCFEEGEKIGNLKSDISTKYGERGRNIANLCSANYLETWFMPTYDLLEKNLKDPNEAMKKFRPLYFNMVEQLPFTIFVSGQTKEEEIKELIESKAERNLKYGIKFLNIHGIGERNIKRIYDAINHIKKKYKNAVTSITDENNIIFVRIEFRD